MTTISILDDRARILVGDCIAVLDAMEADSVDCVVTSPPYWGLRDYGVEGQIGLEPTLAEHLHVMVRVFDAVRRVLKPTGTLWLNYGDCYATQPNGRTAAATKAAGGDDRTFRDKPFSTVGPIYKPEYEKTPRTGTSANKGNGAAAHGGRVIAGGYLKNKDLCMIPNRLAIALQDAGWWVRSEIVWGKPNPMPDSSGAYRPATAHEKIFLLTKTCDGDVWRARDTGEIRFDPDLGETCPLVTKPDTVANRWVRIGSYYDAEAVKVGLQASSVQRLSQDVESQAGSSRANAGRKTNGTMKAVGGYRARSNYGRHTLGEALPERDRRIERKYEGVANGSGVSAPHKGPEQARKKSRGTTPRHADHIQNEFLDDLGRGHGRYLRNFEPAALDVWPIATKPFSEAHFATFPPELAERCILAGCPPGGTVLDPFGGAGTTALVALRHGRTAKLIELNPDYASIAARRIEREWRVPQREQTDDFGPLFGRAAE